MIARKPLVGIVTTSRADFGIYLPVLRAIRDDGGLDLRLWVTGMHLSPEFGLTADQVAESGFAIADRIEGLLSSDSEEGVAASMGLTTLRFGHSLNRQRPDILVVLGDRYEMHAAALAAVPLRIPIAHIHGGEETRNAIDNVFRHSLTKLAHLHFTATELARQRVVAMGEMPDRVIVAGAPSLDNLRGMKLLDRRTLARRFGLPVEPFVLATYHPETLKPEAAHRDLAAIWSAVSAGFDGPIVFTAANADAAGREVNRAIDDLRDAHADRITVVGTLGTLGYFSAMKAAALMVGNSSSGIIEAASLGLPVVNVGDRQAGRERSANVIDAPASPGALRKAIAEALSPEHRKRSASARNIYGDGAAAGRIVAGIRRFLADGAPIAKSFHLD